VAGSQVAAKDAPSKLTALHPGTSVTNALINAPAFFTESCGEIVGVGVGAGVGVADEQLTIAAIAITLNRTSSRCFVPMFGRYRRSVAPAIGWISRDDGILSIESN
jgi:hypothetical protein